MSEGKPEATERLRNLEAVAFAVLVVAHPRELTEAEVRRDLTSVEDSPERLAAIDRAIEGLVDIGLVARDGDRLRLTPPAVRAAELELGL
jgi:hypothetical protein